MIGTTLGRYRVLEKAGAGGMGVVYRARDERLGRDVALKVLPSQYAAEPARLSRLEREARSASALNHPNIVTIYEIGQEGATPFIAMEWVAGRTLRERLFAGPLPIHELLELAAQIAAGLAKAHEAGIVHRDLKPGNIMVTDDGVVKILDFGLAKFLRAGTAQPNDPEQTRDAAETRAGTVLGTAPYMSPEQVRGEDLDFRSDQFSAGLVLHEMATGKRAFERETDVQTMAAILSDEPAPLRTLNAEVPAEFGGVIRRCLEKDPSHRYESTAKLARDLEQIRLGHLLNQLRPASTVHVPAAAQRSVSRAMLLGILGVIAAIGATTLILHWRAPPVAVHAPGVKTVAVPTQPALAVLPFRALSEAPADRELGLGLTDAIVTGLGGSAELIVRPTRTVLAYQDKTTDPIEAGKALQVAAILDGTVQRAGPRLRVNVQLWRVADGVSLWTQKYDIDSADVFSVQDKIGTSVAQALRVQLTDAARARLGAAPSKDPAVYSLLLRGRSLALRQGRETLQTAISLYEQALQKEPNNAQAHAWLAQASRMHSFLHDPNNPLWLEKAERHSRRALELDPNLAEAYAAEAAVLWTPQRGFQHDRAMALFRKALELNPNLATERGYYAVILSHVGLFDRAATESERALQSDPENVRAMAAVAENSVLRAQNYLMSGQPSLGEEAARSALRVDPDYSLAKMALLEALIWQNKLDEALALLARNYFGEARYFSLWFSGLVAAKRGRHAEAESQGLQAAKESEGLGPYHHVTYGLAQIYALSGKNGQAVRWLRRTAETGMPCYPLFRDDPVLRNLRGDPGYEKLLEEMRREWERRRAQF
jgi:TolB-like protein/Tfp pilus assembly protein PilF